jgi:glycosyltransferase involved in cell wall biosynthesis
MIDCSIKHSIVVICFNQEKTIIDALKSVLDQTVAPFELVVLDDASSDLTAEVAQSYLEAQTPQFAWSVLKNAKNLGIAKNTKKIETVATGNVITHLSGDDRLDLRTVEVSNKLIRLNQFNPDEDLFISISPTKLFYSDRTEIIDYKILGRSLTKSIIRKTIPFVKIGFSRKAFLNSEYPSDIGVWADWFWDVSICMQPGMKFYEISTPLYWYTVGVGVGARSSDLALRNSYLSAAKLILQKFNNNIKIIDKIYLLGEIAYLQSKLSRSALDKIYAFILYVLNAITCRDMVIFKSMTIRYVPSRLHTWIKSIRG